MQTVYWIVYCLSANSRAHTLTNTHTHTRTHTRTRTHTHTHTGHSEGLNSSLAVSTIYIYFIDLVSDLYIILKLRKHSLKIHFLFWSVCRCYNWPLLCVKDGKDVLAGHEALFYVSHLQVVQRKHVFLLFFLDNETDNGHLLLSYIDSMPGLLFSIQTWQSFKNQPIKILIRFSTVLTNCIRSFYKLVSQVGKFFIIRHYVGLNLCACLLWDTKEETIRLTVLVVLFHLITMNRDWIFHKVNE